MQELAILRKESKIAKEKVKYLQSNLELKNKQQLKEDTAKLTSIEEEKINLKNQKDKALKAKEDAETDLERFKLQFENMQN